MSTYRGSGTVGSGSTLQTEASDVTSVPYGDIAASDVQSALNELDDEKVAIAGDTMTGALTVNAALTTTGAFTSVGIDDNATSTAITIDASENVGIGVTPEAWATGWDVLQLGPKTSIAATANTSWYMRNAYYDGAWKYQNTDEAQYFDMTSGGGYGFYVAPSGTADTAITWTTALTIDNSANATFGGNVGIGDGKSYYVGSGNDALFTHDGAVAAIRNLTGAFYIDSVGGSNIFRTGGGYATALTLDTSQNATFGGNVGIGVTPETWAVQVDALQLGRVSSVIGIDFGAGSSQTYTLHNSYYDGAWKYQDTAAASQIYHTSTGQMAFKVAPSGTADTAISWTTALTLDNSANATFGGNVTASVSGADVNIKATQSGDFFPQVDIERTGGTTKTNRTYRASIGSAGNFFIYDVTGAQVPLSINTAMDATFGGDVIVGASHSIRLPNVADAGAHTYLYSDGTGTSRTFGIKYTAGGTPHFYLDSVGNATFGGDVSLADNKVLYIGTGNDMRLTHTGTASYFDNYIGGLYIRERVNSTSIIMSAYNSSGVDKDCARFGGATPYVRLYYDGVQVGQTHSLGIETGDFSSSGANIGAILRTSGQLTTSQNTTGAVAHVLFYNPNGSVGTITTSGTATAYNTTSDKRLKTSHGLVNNASLLLNQIEVHDYHFNADKSLELQGVMAQDVYEVYPNAVSKPENEDDNWAVDYSKFVPLMMANIQELNKKVEALTCQAH